MLRGLCLHLTKLHGHESAASKILWRINIITAGLRDWL